MNEKKETCVFITCIKRNSPACLMQKKKKTHYIKLSMYDELQVRSQCF